jgi:hypothetical protein
MCDLRYFGNIYKHAVLWPMVTTATINHLRRGTDSKAKSRCFKRSRNRNIHPLNSDNAQQWVQPIQSISLYSTSFVNLCRLAFRRGVFRLFEERNIPASEVYWIQVLPLFPTDNSDIPVLVPSRESRRCFLPHILQRHPSSP